MRCPFEDSADLEPMYEVLDVLASAVAGSASPANKYHHNSVRRDVVAMLRS